jgi:hypothetical protein
MASKLANLQSALDNTRTAPSATNEGRRLKAPASVKTETTTTAPSSDRQANRVGRVNIAAWLDPAFKNSIRLIQARRPGTIQEIMEEALNDLFAKYDVPQVSSSAE